jgi:hypothetical protein
MYSYLVPEHGGLDRVQVINIIGLLEIYDAFTLVLASHT